MVVRDDGLEEESDRLDLPLRALPHPGEYGLPVGASLIAVLADEMDDEPELYRLVMNDPPQESDFAPTVSARQADARGIPEIIRCGLSHYLEVEQADAVRRKPGSMIARVTLRRGRWIAAARTGASPGHVTVWGRPNAFVDSAEVVVR